MSVSVVVAAWRNCDGLGECLDALEGQRREGVEVIVVYSGGETVEVKGLQERFGWAWWMNAAGVGRANEGLREGMKTPTPALPRSTGSGGKSGGARGIWEGDKSGGGRALLTPHLWGIGMAVANNAVVAVTTAHFCPSNDWVERIEAAFATWDVAGIGGRIHPPVGRGWVAWATYFQRYNAYLHLHEATVAHDIAADNAAYRRSDLIRHPRFFSDGFWEPDFHKVLEEEGKKLMFVPEVGVRMTTAFGFWPFIGQRFRHAIQFGQARVRGRGMGYRLVRVIASPLIPAVFGIKIAGRVWRSGKYRGAFVMSLPVLWCFLMAWGLGEMCGYLLPEGKAAMKGEAA